MRVIVNKFVHVIIGTIFLGVALWRIFAYHLTDNHHLGYLLFFLYLFDIKTLLSSVYFKLSCFSALINLASSRLFFKLSFSSCSVIVFTIYQFLGVSYVSNSCHSYLGRSNLPTISLRINSFKYICSINHGAGLIRSYSSSACTRLLNATYERKGELKLDPNFVTGLVESEGSFSIVKHRDARAKFGMTVSLRFKITMLVNETVLIKKVHDFFGVGSFYIDERYGTINYIVRDKISLKVIKNHFIKYPLRGSKHLDFLDFMRALELMEQNLHRSKEEFELLVSLSEGMNSLRNDYSKMPPVHTIKANLEFIPIDGNYINGFIAGDGCLFLRTKSNFGSMGLQISQHVVNSPLMKEILEFFTLGLNVYSHGKGKKSVQITLAGKKFWKEVIAKHFSIYPLHGSKTLRLEKMITIYKIIESGEHLKRVGRVASWKPEYKERILKIWNDDYEV